MRTAVQQSAESRQTENFMARMRYKFSEGASLFARAAGRPSAFMLALIVVILWAVTGPIFNYSDTWQLVINTGTTIVTFLMVFLIQNSQNRDSAAIQVKLDEIIRAGESQNLFVGIEHLTEDEIEELREMCESRAKAGPARNRKSSPTKGRNSGTHSHVAPSGGK